MMGVINRILLLGALLLQILAVAWTNGKINVGIVKVTGYDFKDENKSVHLTSWVEYDDPMEAQDMQILKHMEEVRKIVALGLMARDQVGIKVRQMLSQLKITNYELRNEYKNLIMDELNVKNVVAEKGKGELEVELDTMLTDDLKLEGFTS